ncbi:glutathione-dependent formaldehyde-activating [Tieghemostelium lacteum]|uniref:Glutathione-dependent formaldehyde-activating n=1 Tax=Tieghemostelium lacteum TaxID=361077 RepID=A0A151ZE58_TIELA|nr:glutathione-dependent formaldehyde-activating [Tieghemostelium lacteum]|eukprot:KYQ92231.1 glutathione-dependent formaldehyde-activating [Tieghemostelium lacteum]
MSEQIINQTNDDGVTLKGGCHCGKIRFDLSISKEAAECIEVYDCNCSICTKKGILHLITSTKRFSFTGKEDLSTYTFNTGVAQHYFCSKCGICPFYIPRSNPDGYDINARCLDDFSKFKIKVIPYDGANWEQAPKLDHLSK